MTTDVNPSFAQFIRTGRLNRFYLWASLSMTIALFSIFKIFYPYPNMVMDSYVYIKAVVEHLDANSFPIGYSKLLQLFCLFSRSTLLLVGLQYLFLESACLLFFFTLLFFFRPAQLISALLFLFLFCNPLFLFVSNFIMSDALFTALSVFWVTQLIWIIVRPRPSMLWIHGLFLILVFTVRYNAFYYPLVASVALLLSRLPNWHKIAAILLPLGVIGLFIGYTRSQMQQLSGVSQFSAFGGWQIANNALYMYGHIYQEDKKPIPAKFYALDSAVRHYFDSTHHVESLLEYDAAEPGFYYSADYNSPLVRYMYWRYGQDTVFQNFRKWGPMGTTCSEYGSFLIKRHPLDYVRYFVWPNTLRYLTPPTEVFSKHSAFFLRDDEFGKMARQLFDLRTLMADSYLIEWRTFVLSWYPLFFTLLNLLFVLGFLGFVSFGGLKKSGPTTNYVFLMIAGLWLLNLFFSVMASCVVLRYQIFIMIVQFPFALLLIDLVYRDTAKMAPQVVVKTSDNPSSSTRV